MKGKVTGRDLLDDPQAAATLERLRKISGSVPVKDQAEACLRTILTRTASGLFRPEELPRYLQVQLAPGAKGVPAWDDLTGERLTQVGMARHAGCVRADECGTVLPTLSPVTIDYAASVEGHEVCSSAAYDPGITTASFEEGVHHTVMTAPDLTVTRSVFPHMLMNLPFVQVSFILRNTSSQFHAVTLVLLVKPFDEDGLTGIERFSFSPDNILFINGKRIAFARERPSSMTATVYDPRAARMVPADLGREITAPAGLMQLRLSFDHQLEPEGSASVTLFFFTDADVALKRDDLALLVAQSPSILEQEHRLIAGKRGNIWYHTGDERLNRFAANQLLHLPALESEASAAVGHGADPMTLFALVQAYDRTGETETAAGLLRSYVDRLPASGAPLTPDLLAAYAGFTIALGWHLKVARQVQLRRQLFPLVDQFILRLAQISIAESSVIIPMMSPLRRSGAFLYLVLSKAIESYEGMLTGKDERRVKLCDDLQLRLLRQMDGDRTAPMAQHDPTFDDMALIAAYALYGVHGTEDTTLANSMGWIADHWQADGFIRNPYAASLADLRLSFLFAKALILRQNTQGLVFLRQGCGHLGVSDALPDYLDLATDRALLGSRHSAVATALAMEWLSNIIFIERGTYLSVAPAPSPALFAGDGIDVHGLLSAFGELSVRMQRRDNKVFFVLHADFLRGVSAIELNFPWELKELVARKGTVKYVTGGTIVMEPADYIEGEAIVASPGPS